MEEALRLAQEAELDVAILDIKVGGAVVFPVAEVLREPHHPLRFCHWLRIDEASAAVPRQPNSSKAF